MADFPVVFFLALNLLLCSRGSSDIAGDRRALLDFLSQILHGTRVRWDSAADSSPCNWFGVRCDPSGSFVQSLRLPGAGLIGRIPPSSIGNLTRLRILSLHSNRLTGGVPPDFGRLTFLRRLYLQGNDFSGGFPVPVTRLTRLTRLDLSSNNFSGALPVGLKNLRNLTGLYLENNEFSGSIPSINLQGLMHLNVSNNKLNGSIPRFMASRFNSSSFAGNIDLCGPPLTKPCKPIPPPSSSPSPGVATVNPPAKKSGSGLAKGAIVAISAGSVLVFLLLILVLLLCLRRRDRSRPPNASKHPATRSTAAAEAGASSSKDDVFGGTSAAEAERNRLVFFEGSGYGFDLEDLLRASAEVLGKGSAGTSYKAVLAEGPTVVVKRLRDVALTTREFEAQMEALGKMKHDHVVPLRAYYYSKDEKLLVSDYLAAGSLSALLHGSRGSGRVPLDWDSRMRVAVGTARGLAHLHLAGNLVHGGIKSSNVLLRPDHDAAVADFGLHQLGGSSAGVPPGRIAGYRAPEAVEARRATARSDVYSFGVLLLELLTGKSPGQASMGEGIDLPRWVQSVVREEWTAEVFDAELMQYHSAEEEMVQLLQVAMACVATVPDQRPGMAEVVRMVEEVSRGGETTDDGLRQSSDDPSLERTPPAARTP